MTRELLWVRCGSRMGRHHTSHHTPLIPSLPLVLLVLHLLVCVVEVSSLLVAQINWPSAAVIFHLT
jgi:hypothetical protein